MEQRIEQNTDVTLAELVGRDVFRRFLEYHRSSVYTLQAVEGGTVATLSDYSALWAVPFCPDDPDRPGEQGCYWVDSDTGVTAGLEVVDYGGVAVRVRAVFFVVWHRQDNGTWTPCPIYGEADTDYATYYGHPVVTPIADGEIGLYTHADFNMVFPAIAEAPERIRALAREQRYVLSRAGFKMLYVDRLSV
jgi:hypothetical protein